MTPRKTPTRPRLAAALACVTLAGLASKLYPGPPGGWLRDYGAGVAYVVFWILAVLLLRPSLGAVRVAALVLLVTCTLEVLQLWHPPALEALRGSFLGHALIGSSFSAWDFPHYALGALLGAGLAKRLGEPRQANRSPA